MSRKTLFVEVLLPLALPELYTYRVPFELNDEIKVGKRVVVQFGQSRVYSAIVISITEKIPIGYQVKYILNVLDEHAIISEKQIEFWRWISSYYMCTLGEVMNAALPSGLKLNSETKIILSGNTGLSTDNLSDKEFLVYEALQIQQVLSLKDVADIIETKKVIPLIKTLIEKGFVLTEEEIQIKYKAKTETFIQLRNELANEVDLTNILNSLEKKAEKQFDLLMAFLTHSNYFQGKTIELSKSFLLEKSGASAAAFTALLKKDILISYEKEISRLIAYDSKTSTDEIILSPEQNIALDEIKNQFKTKNTILFQGVTGSGKTEIYTKLIQDCLNEGKQVLYLVPEISLTTQTINRLRKYFGNDVGVYHSRNNENERVEVWNKVNALSENPYKIILGARSSLFLPFSNIGLIIVDEEHDASYKQIDPAPRYFGRDLALFLASQHGAKCLLGTASPSIESYYNAKIGKFGFVKLDQRFNNILLPKIEIINLQQHTDKEMRSHFSVFLTDAIKKALEKKEQVIVFQNRRGYAPRLVCSLCEWTPQCKNCDVSLTFHKAIGKLKCHYCGYTAELPTICPACHNVELKLKGFGTEKIESDLPILFPGAKIQRMDLDSTRSKNAYQEIINDFEDRRIDILVGTQMVTKGLDFDNVSIVGVMNADAALSFPDFRSFERSFQQLTQVSGRAGRKGKQGQVYIQTRNPNHPVIQHLTDGSQEKFLESILIDRKNYKYPPYYRLILITLKHVDSQLINEASKHFSDLIKPHLGSRVLGPEFPIVGRIKNLYLKNFLVKIEINSSSKQVKEILMQAKAEFLSIKRYQSVKLVFDVDPQ